MLVFERTEYLLFFGVGLPTPGAVAVGVAALRAHGHTVIRLVVRFDIMQQVERAMGWTHGDKTNPTDIQNQARPYFGCDTIPAPTTISGSEWEVVAFPVITRGKVEEVNA